MSIGYAPPVVTSITADKSSPQEPGTAITWTATVTGGTAPLQYRFTRTRSVSDPIVTMCDYGNKSVRKSPAGVWSVVQDWSTGTTYT